MQRGGVAVSGVSRTVTTDENGRFSFPRLPAGQFQLMIVHNQFLQMNYGQRRYGGQGAFIPIDDGEQATLKVALERGGVITGTVLGPDGEPQRQAQVRGLRYIRNNGVRRLQAQSYVSTDDRGVYRMFGLQPGEYLIAVTPNPSDAMNAERFGPQAELLERAIVSAQVTPPTAPGMPSTVTIPIPPQPQPGQTAPTPMYVPTFAPSVASPSGATVVALKAGEERSSVDILVRLTAATTLQVDVSSPVDQGVNVQFSITSDDPAGDTTEGGQMRDQNGRVFFRGLRPGKYTLVAQTVPAPPTFVPGQAPGPPPVLADAQKLWARVPIEVSGEPLLSTTVTLQPARSISGVVIFDTTRPVDLTRTRMTVTLAAAPVGPAVYFNAPPQAQVSPDGRFTITGVVAGRYTIRASGAGGYLRSSVVAGQDTLDFPLDFTGERDITDAVVTMADTASVLNGTLTDSAGKPAPDYTIVVAPSDSRYWVPGSRRIATSRPAVDGHYFFSSLPPGSYFLAAVVDLENGAQFDPEFLRELASTSVPVTIMEGGKAVQDLRVR